MTAEIEERTIAPERPAEAPAPPDSEHIPFDEFARSIRGDLNLSQKKLRVRSYLEHRLRAQNNGNRNTMNAAFLALQRRGFPSQAELENFRSGYDRWWKAHLYRVRRAARNGEGKNS